MVGTSHGFRMQLGEIRSGIEIPLSGNMNLVASAELEKSGLSIVASWRVVTMYGISHVCY